MKYKLTMILEDEDGLKIEREFRFSDDESLYATNEVDDMIDSLKKSKKPL